MSQMHQMQMSYMPVEDRILFRINTKARQEFRFWMTRRFTSLLWESFARILSESHPPSQGEEAPTTVKDPIAESAKQEIKHQEIVSDSDFETQYDESTYLPLGEEPVLLFSVGVKPDARGQALFCLHPENGEGIEIALNEQILHSLCKLVADTVAKAGWGLELRFVSPPPEEEGGSGLN
jgi:hypothetical protein